MITTKECSSCKEEKEATLENFSPHPLGKLKLNSICKPCAAIKQREYRNNLDPQRLKEMKKGWARDTHLRRSYGLDRKTYAVEVEAREGKCDLCKKQPNSNLVPDHNHQTGKLRGFLCYSCNNGIGQLGDDYASIYRAAEYLLKNEVG